MLSVRDVDAYYLQRNISTFFSDSNHAQIVEGQLLETLEESINESEMMVDGGGGGGGDGGDEER